ncbi:MAG: O-antigen ligase family protein [Actinomycetota bacterium]
MGRDTFGWVASLVLAAQWFFVDLDFSQVGLAGSGPDVVKWAVLAPIALLPAFALPLLSPSLGRELRRGPQAWMTAWLAWSLVTIGWTLEPRQTVLQGISIVGLWIYGYWFSATFGVERFLRVAMVSVSAFLVVGLGRDLATGNISLDGSERFFGITFAATNLARVAMLALFIGVAVWRDPRWRRLATPCIALAVVCLLGTHTRTVLLAILLGVAYLAGRRFGWRVGALAFAGVALATTLAIVVAADTAVVSRGEGTADLGSFNGRTTIWPIAFDDISERPLLGYGTASTAGLWERAETDGEIVWNAKNSHNLVLDLLLAQGIVGAALFVGGIVQYWRHSARRVPEMMNAVIIAVLASGVTEAIINRPSVSILVLAAGFGAAGARATDREAPRSAVAVG